MAIILSNWRPASNREGLVPARRCPYYVKLFRPWLLLLLPSTASFPTMCSAENRGHEASLLRGHFITCVSCGEGQGRLVAQSVLVLPHQQQSRTTHIFQICRSRYHSSLIQTLSSRVCDSSDIGKLYNKYARSEDTTLKYQTGHARAWPLIGYILSCLVSPCRRQPPPLTPRWDPMLPWFHSRRQQEAGITFPSPFSHPNPSRQCHAGASCVIQTGSWCDLRN